MKQIKAFDAARARLVRVNGSRTKRAASVIVELDGVRYYVTNDVWNRIAADSTLPVFVDVSNDPDGEQRRWLAVPSRF